MAKTYFPFQLFKIRWLEALVTVVVGLAVGLGFFFFLPTQAEVPGFSAAKADQAFQLIQDHANDPAFIILDIRTPREFTQGHIEGAVNIDYYAPGFETKIYKLNRETTYLVYCRSGNRSGQSMPKFAKLGFKSIVHMTNGLRPWAAKNLPLVPSK